MKVKIPPRKKNIPAFLCVLKYDRNRATNNIQKEPARKIRVEWRQMVECVQRQRTHSAVEILRDGD